MEPKENQTSSGRARRIERLIDDVRTARAAGKDVDDQAIVAAHPDLAPELEAELAKLRRVQAARLAAEAAETIAPPSEEAVRAMAAEMERPMIQAPGYSILREIGRGGQAVVFLAIQLSTGRKVAVKVMREGLLADERAHARFQREVQALAALNHPNIVTIFDTGRATDGSRFIAMNYIGGSTLDEYMKYRHRKDPADPSRLLRLFLKICAAVNVAHTRGIVHRDLKPNNIRIDERGEPQILDFGLARTAMDRFIRGSDQPVSITGEFLGSLPWSSPEQAQGNPDDIDVRTDVYSLGVILYQILTGGKFPYEVVGNIRDVLNNILTVDPTPPSKVMAAFLAKQVQDKRRETAGATPMVNEAIERIVLKALAKKRERRYQTAGELGRDIANYLSGQRTTAPIAERQETKWLRQAVLWTAGIAALLCVLVGVGWLILAHVRSQHTEQIASIGQPAAISAVPAVQPKIAGESDGWIDVFNGKDIEGWKIGGHNWTVQDGILIGTWGNRLDLPEPDVQNFRLRIEAMTNDDGVARVIFRNLNNAMYVVRIDANSVSDNRTVMMDWVLPGENQHIKTIHTPVLQANSWFEVELAVDGPHVAVDLNGKEIATIEAEHLQSGSIGFGTGTVARTTVLKIRKVQFMALPDSPVSPHTAIGALADTGPVAAGAVNVATTSAPAEVVTKGPPDDASPMGDLQYKFFPQQISWSDAADQCVRMGGNLACPQTVEQLTFLRQLKGDGMTAWVGGSCDDKGNWRWLDGQPIDASVLNGSAEPAAFRWLFITRNGKLSARPQSGKIDGAAVPIVQGFICQWKR